MIYMVPNEIDQMNPRFNGERLIFNCLSNLDIDGYALHSVWQNNHNKKLFSEIDFLLITKYGLLCIEVKGGQEIYRENGIWYSKNKASEINKIKNPYEQAKTCRYALEKQLKKESNIKNILVGHAVAFPECVFNCKSSEFPQEITYDCSSINFKEFIINAYKYWGKELSEKQNFIPHTLSQQNMKDIVTILRRNFHVIPSFSIENEQIETKMLEATQEQYDYLCDVFENNNRILVKGVAGTGKSILAIEQFKQLVAQNKKVAYICFNSNMAEYARIQVDSVPDGCFIGTFHSLINKYIDVSEYINNEHLNIFSDFIEQKIVPETFAYLIIDEAQDLMDLDAIEVLSTFIDDGIDNGKWTMFFDPNQNIFKTTSDFMDAFEYLKDGCHAVVHTLLKNCRNTKQTAEITSTLTDIKPAKQMNIIGQEPVIEFYDDDNDILSLLKKYIQGLITSGILANNITILSPYTLSKTGLAGVSSICNKKLRENVDIKNKSNDILKFYTIKTYKGLESDYIFCINIEDINKDVSRLNNYVAFSRAKKQLFIFAKKTTEHDIIDALSNAIKNM